MRIDINDQYCITSDAYNFVVQQKYIATKGKTKGTEQLRAIGFFPELSQALRGFATLSLMRSEVKTIVELQRRIRELGSQIEAAIASFERNRVAIEEEAAI